MREFFFLFISQDTKRVEIEIKNKKIKLNAISKKVVDNFSF